jgi:hypothetical protein
MAKKPKTTEESIGLKLKQSPITKDIIKPNEQVNSVIIRRTTVVAGKYKITNPPIQDNIP